MVERMLTVGVLTPHVTAGPEIEIPAMSSGRVRTLVSRIPPPRPGSLALTAPQHLRRAALPEAVDAAAEEFRHGSVDAIAYASTSSAYIMGFAAEVVLIDRLRDRWGVPAASSGRAAVQALRAHGVEHVALVHPPWFDDETSDLGAAYFRAQGFDAVASRAETLPLDPAQVLPGPVADWVSHHVDDKVQAVVLGGNGFHAAGAIDEIERRTDRLVLEANQVLLWAILLESEADVEVTGYGRLLSEPRSDRTAQP